MAGYPPPSGGTAQGAIIALILGICGIFLCQLAAPFAWHFGNEAERTIAASGGTLGGREMAIAGKIMGIIGTVLLVIVVVGFLLIFVLGASILTFG